MENPTWWHLGRIVQIKNTRVCETQDRMVKRSIEQNLRIKNFEARNRNFETNIVIQNQGTKQREQRTPGDCWQWETNGQCSEGDNCSFRHDINKRAKSTQPNPSPRSSARQNERNALRTRCPRGRRALPQDWLRRLHVLKDTTQMSCIRWSTSSGSSFQLMTGVTVDIGSFLSWLLSRLTTGCNTISCQSFFFNMTSALLASFFWDLLQGCSSTWRCAEEHFSPNLHPLSDLWNKHSGGRHFSQNGVVWVPSRQDHRAHDNWVVSFRTWSRRSLFLRKSSNMQKPIQRVKFTKVVARHTKIRDQNPSLGCICPGEPHQRSPNAPKFEDRSQEETKWQGAREAVWKLANKSHWRSKKEQHSCHIRKVGACVHQILNLRKENLLSTPAHWCIWSAKRIWIPLNWNLDDIKKSDDGCNSQWWSADATKRPQCMSRNWIYSWLWKSSRTCQQYCRSVSFAMNTDTHTSGSTVKNHISLKTGFGQFATRKISFRLWFQACQIRLLDLHRLQRHLRDRGVIAQHLLPARLHHLQQVKFRLENERIELRMTSLQ